LKIIGRHLAKDAQFYSKLIQSTLRSADSLAMVLNKKEKFLGPVRFLKSGLVECVNLKIIKKSYSATAYLVFNGF